MVKILLIHPSKISEVTVDCLPSYPLGLLYNASVLRDAGHKVAILDLGVLDVKYSDLNRLVHKFKPDLIGITVVTVFYYEMKKICEYIEGVPIVLGGVHPTSLPELTLTQTKADFLILGEGEKTIVELASYFENGGNLENIKGLCYKKDGEIIINERRELIKDLDEIPFPAWDLLNLDKYNSIFKSGYKTFFDYSEFLPLVTTRGCPYKCTFCASTFFWGPSIRFRSVENVIQEILFDIKQYNVKTFEIWDDNFTINKKRVINFCKEIVKRNIKVSFYLPNGVRIDTLDRPLIKIMKLAGFKGLVLSPESGSQEILNNVNKKLDLKIVPKVAKMLQEERMFTTAYFILGLPGETLNTAYQTIKFAASLPINGLTFFIFTPIPGSQLFKEWVKDKDLNKVVWTTNFMGRQNFEQKVMCNLSLEQLKKFRSLGYIMFVMRYKNLFRWLRRFNRHNIKPFILTVRKTYLSLIIDLILKKK